MNLLLPAPLLIPLFCAILSLLGRKSVATQRFVAVSGCGLNLVVSACLLYVVDNEGIQVVQAGSWPAPYGISLVVDRLSAIMLVLSGLMGSAVAVFSLAAIDESRQKFGFFFFYHTLLMGVNGSFLTGDLFNLYVWFEVMLMSSFALMSLGSERAQLEGGIKYVALNVLSTAFFLAALGILYGMTGTLNMAHLATIARSAGDQGMLTTVSMLFMIAFGIKSAAFPLFFWLPASYHTPPSPVSAIFAGLLTKVGVYALIRIFTLVFVHDAGFTHTILLVASGLTMLTGVLGAAAQMEMRRILSFHIVSQVGYMIMGLGLFTPLALAGSVFYIIHHVIVKTNLFLVAGVVAFRTGTNELKAVGGFVRTMPWLALFFLIPAMSLAGLPPLSGFFAKLMLIVASFRESSWIVAVTALAVGFLTLYSMTKIWNEVFWKPMPATSAEVLAERPWTIRDRVFLFGPIIALALCTVLIGLGVESVFALSERTAGQLLNPDEYIRAVLTEAVRP